ncbi:DUF2461 domain-containing protein [Winogradskyella echinorum]|uniref:DUF2461 domain-containing protein n=1 Tax=Winogradskyella echinorum TaxID=538189 RepID=A0ABR6Y0J9_9FLAO|nr:DUF2461 domain-containing protein [Winogradskyella echinorum]MBC3846268.1 DUF2461 domain-containing protein [Winogradskyella echinorum]MBC5750616.1 DUF2461 domain-containing protein [Winogradskyella echinorum]
MSYSIPKEALSFFKKLEKNNDRDWFNEHKPEFKAIEAKVKAAYNHLGELMNAHDQIEKIKMFRIYRDVRFSKNKQPYKTHFGGSFARKKPELRGGYYLHIQPNNESFIATGFWQPSKEDLLRIRKEFEMDDSEMRAILKDKTFKVTWGDFVGDELKTAPKGFDKEHAAIDLIRRKQFIFTKKYTDREVVADGFLEEVNKSFKDIRPYFNYMSDVLTTNLNGESLL